MFAAKLLRSNAQKDRRPGRDPKRPRLSSRPARDGIDRLSDLPRPLLHHIMSLLPNESTIHMSVLSRHFLSVCRSYPVIEFDYRTFARRSPHGPSTRLFSEYIQDHLRRRQLSCDLQRFTLKCLSFEDNDRHAEDAVRAIGSFLLENNVKELHINCGNSTLPGLPQALFSSSSARKIALFGLEIGPESFVIDAPRLEDLKLSHCAAGLSITLDSPRLKTALISHISGPFTTIHIAGSGASLVSILYRAGRREPCMLRNLSSCRNLRTLDIRHFTMNDKWFRDEVSPLPAIVGILLKHCEGPRNLFLRNKKLEIMRMEECSDIDTITIVARNLGYFTYCHQGYDSQCQINIRECTNLRDLQLRGASATVTSEWIEENIPRFEFLERLVLANSNLLEDLRLHSRRLRSLHLIRCKDLRSFNIRTPELVSFVFDGRLSFAPPTLVHSNKLNAVIRFYNFNKNDFTNLGDFLAYFGHCRTLTLSCYRDERFIFPVSDRVGMIPPLFQLRHLKINVTVMYFPSFKLIESALWLAPLPLTLHLALNSKPYVTIQFHYKVGDNVRRFHGATSFCCKSYPIKCWRHFVSAVEIETFSNFNETWETLENFFVQNAGFPVEVRRIMTA